MGNIPQSVPFRTPGIQTRDARIGGTQRPERTDRFGTQHQSYALSKERRIEPYRIPNKIWKVKRGSTEIFGRVGDVKSYSGAISQRGRGWAGVDCSCGSRASRECARFAFMLSCSGHPPPYSETIMAKPVLDDHKRSGKRFIPKLVDSLGQKLEYVQWVNRIVPDLIWIALIIQKHGVNDGRRLAIEIARAAESQREGSSRYWFACASTFERIDEQGRRSIIEALSRRGLLDAIAVAILPLSARFRQFPMRFVNQSVPSCNGSHTRAINLAITEMCNRHSVVATQVQIVATEIGYAIGMMIDATGRPSIPFDAISEFPDSDRSQLLAGTSRCTVSSIGMGPLESAAPSWPREFWGSGPTGTTCQYTRASRPKITARPSTLIELVDNFVSRSRRETDEVWCKVSAAMSASDLGDVYAALISRQLSLATNLARCPSGWNPHLAPVVLRAMADNYITAAWIVCDPENRAAQFVDYGLGQEKLSIEIRKNYQEEGDTDSDPVAEMSDAWLNSERFSFLTEVNVGSWTGKSVREMAIEAGCKDFYQLVYTPFSAASHSMWNHIAKYNLTYCNNPIHRPHRVPLDYDFDIDPNYLFLASKYLEKILLLFETQIRFTRRYRSTLDFLISDLNCIFDS